MLVFRVCCKLHNFLVAERDPFDGMNDAMERDAALRTPVLTGGDEPLPRHLHGRVTAKDRREKMLVALRAAGLRRRPRRN